MNRIVPVSAVAAILLGLSLVPRTVNLDEGFLPPNDLSISIGSSQDKGITEAQFNAVLDEIQALYGPVVAARGGTLVINRWWNRNTVNASAQRHGPDKNIYVINMYGGLARHESITQDGFALVACHEIGHHLGGAPKYPGLLWPSNEGQADYYASLKCLHRVFASAGAASFTRLASDEGVARASCEKSYSSPIDQALCVRSAMAGMSVTTLLRISRKETVLPHFDTPDPKAAAQTENIHPATQCRLDTYFAGSLCARPVDDALDDKNPAPGTCTRSAGYTLGLRPLCWYKPPVGEPQAPVARRQAPKAPALVSVLTQTNPWKGF